MRTLLKFFIIIVLIFGLILFLYPFPNFFWNIWHTKDINLVNSLSTTLGKQSVLSKQLRCWEVTNSRCGVELSFTTPLSLNDFKDKIESLGYTNKFFSEVDGNGFFSILEFSGHTIEYKNTKYSVGNPLVLVKDKPKAYGYYLEDPNGKKVSIDFFEKPLQPLHVDGKPFEGNIIRIIYYTRGR